ncbi:MAG: Gfo/Idh/MocA family oxidoreductase [Anaerolineae bacterium]|nr:Gfo/Idh/MocA family oxidoreductase [Anaerolineae bacterium]
MPDTGANPVRAAIIGCGGMARHHIRQMLQQQDTTRIEVVCEPSPAAYAAAGEIFKVAGLEPPPNQPDLARLLAGYGDRLDAAFIITPHAYHHGQTVACLEQGLDVLLEKPMVMNAAEARSLIAARDRTGKLLVVAFPGSLSPRIRMAAAMLRSGEVGPILSISGVVWQNWGPTTVGTWRQQPQISGGGFLFDTGAHMLNTVADLAGEDFVEVAAWLDNNGRPVDTRAAVIARLSSGAMVTINGCGEAIPSCASDVRVFCAKAIVRTGIWGEFLEIQRYGHKRLRTVQVPPSLGVWEQFLAVREGLMPNPCPPEVGLRMARLWDAIKASAAKGGVPVQAQNG